LPAQLFLLAVDPRRQRLTARIELGYVLRAAALVDLQLSGHLVDVDGRPKATDSAAAADPVLDGVLRQVTADPRRRWRYWIRKDTRQLIRDVRHQLLAGRRIELAPYRILGLLPAQRIVILDPLLRDRIAILVFTVATVAVIALDAMLLRLSMVCGGLLGIAAGVLGDKMAAKRG